MGKNGKFFDLVSKGDGGEGYLFLSRSSSLIL